MTLRVCAAWLAAGCLLAAPALAKVVPLAAPPKDLSSLPPPLAMPVQPLASLIETSNGLYDRVTDPAYAPARQLHVNVKTANHLFKEKDKTACADATATIDVHFAYPPGQSGPVLARVLTAGWCPKSLTPGMRVLASTSNGGTTAGLLLYSSGSYWIGPISFTQGRLDPRPAGTGLNYYAAEQRFYYGDASLLWNANDRNGSPAARAIADRHGNMMLRVANEPLFPRENLYLRHTPRASVRAPLRNARIVIPEVGQLQGMVASEVGLRVPREPVRDTTQHFTRLTALDGSFAITGSFKLDSKPAAESGPAAPVDLPFLGDVRSIMAYRATYLVETQVQTSLGPPGRYLFDGGLSLPRGKQGLAAMLAGGTTRPATAAEVTQFETRLAKAMQVFAPLEEKRTQDIAFHRRENARLAAMAKAEADRKAAQRAAFGAAFVQAANQMSARMDQERYYQNYKAQQYSNQAYAAAQTRTTGQYVPPAMPAFSPYEMSIMDNYRQMVRDGRISAADHARWQANQLRGNVEHQARVRRMTERSQAAFAAQAAATQQRMNDHLKFVDSGSSTARTSTASDAAARAEQARREQARQAELDKDHAEQQQRAQAALAKAEEERRQREAAIEAEAAKRREANALAARQDAARRDYQPVREAIAVCSPDGSGKSDHFRCWGPNSMPGVAVSPRQTSGWQTPRQWLGHASGCPNPRSSGSTTDGGVVFYCGFGLTSFVRDVYSASGFRGGNGLTYYCRPNQAYCRNTSVP